MTAFGYARVSTADQHLTGQIEALKAAGATHSSFGQVAARPDHRVFNRRTRRHGQSSTTIAEVNKALDSGITSICSTG
jgi:hypothetical protein